MCSVGHAEFPGSHDEDIPIQYTEKKNSYIPANGVPVTEEGNNREEEAILHALLMKTSPNCCKSSIND